MGLAMKYQRQFFNLALAFFTAMSLIFSSQTGIGSVIAAPSKETFQRPLADPIPNVSLDLPAESMLGEDFSFKVSFSNTGTTEGYGPFIDLIFPRNGPDGVNGAPLDGLTFASATYLGSALSPAPTVQTFPAPNGCVNHPYALNSNGSPVQVCGTVGDQLVTILLPFGSFVPNQPAAEVTVQAHMSNLADVDSALTIEARGGYQFGTTPLNDFRTDPSRFSDYTSSSVTPTILKLKKTYVGPEDETATGPNYPREYVISVDIANGQTVTNLQVQDRLPNNMQYISLVSASPANYTILQQPGADRPHNAPDNLLSVQFASVTGNTGDQEATVRFRFFIPLNDANGSPVLSAAAGSPTTSVDDAAASGRWTPVDSRDSQVTVTSDVTPNDHTLTDRSLAIQKSAEIIRDVNGTGLTPGDTVEYTLNFQVSDYFAFQNVVVTDILSDGQHFDTSFTPTLQVFFNETSSTAQSIAAANYTVDTSRIDDGSNPALYDGTTHISFRVSDEKERRGDSSQWIGGCVPLTGTGSATATPNCDETNHGATTAVIKFRAIVQERFTDNFAPNDPWVDQGDILTNHVDVAGDVLAVSNLQPTGSSVTDDSQASLQLERGKVQKSVYAVNGQTISDSATITAGDRVTYRLIYTMPTADIENYFLVDYLPLPIYRASEVTTFDAPGSGPAIPDAGHARFGPSDTFYPYSGIIPTISTNNTQNSVQFTFGNFHGSAHNTRVTDILFTVTVRNDPFADRLFLTNQARVNEGSTNAGEEQFDAIVQVLLTEPVLKITKGVVWSDHAGAVFQPNPPGPVTFDGTQSGTNEAACRARKSGLVNSTNLASNPINSNITGLDGNDLVMYAIVVENTGTGLNGAFDVRVRDSLPAGISYVPNTLCVTDGVGDMINYTASDTNLFTSTGIQLTNPGPTAVPTGVLDPYSATSGRNLAIVTYLGQLSPTIATGTNFTNTATLQSYANEPGGPNFIPGGLTDTARVRTIGSQINKTLIGTNQPFTTGYEVAVGEQVTYRLVITVPQGTTQNATLTDTLDDGLAFVSCNSITLSSTNLTVPNQSCATAVFSTDGEGPEVQGNRMQLSFGNVVNTNPDDDATETITVEYTAVVTNTSFVNRGTYVNNNADFTWSNNSSTGRASDQADNVVVVEPGLVINKSVDPPSGDAGDVVTFTLVLRHDGDIDDTDAFNVILNDVIPAGLTYLPDTLKNTGGLPPTLINANTATGFTVSWDEFPVGSTSTFTFQATLDNDVYPGQKITNTADANWTSLPGDQGSPQTPHNPQSCERSGNPAACGGENNDYVTNGEASVAISDRPDKTLVSTSEDHTTDANVAIGEVVRYRLQTVWPEGTASQVSILDRLPAGMLYLPGATRIAFVCDGSAGCITSSTPEIGASPVISGNETTVESIHPTFAFPESAVTPTEFQSGTQPVFNLGNLVNSDRDPSVEFIVIEFNALVLNVPGNTNNPQTVLTNDFQVRLGSNTISTSETVQVFVVQPELSLKKTPVTLPKDAGDTVTYDLTISNANVANSAAAFDIAISDPLNPDLVLVSVVGTSIPPYATLTNTSSGNTASAVLSRLNPGDQAVVTVTARVADLAAAKKEIKNTAGISYTTLPGPNGTVTNPTGSATPGTNPNDATPPGETNAERIIVGDANASVTLGVPSIEKLPLPAPAEYPIGAEVTYSILVSLPEGTTRDLVVTDNLPDGLVYVSHAIVTTAGGNLPANFNGTLPTPTSNNPTTSGEDLVLTFGDVVTAATPATANNQFLVQVTARILNQASNQNGTVLTNRAGLTFTNPQTNQPESIQSNPVDLKIIEPELEITKVPDVTTPGFGDPVTYTLTIQHLSTSTAPAYDITITDVLPTGLNFVAGSVIVPPGWTANFTAPDTLTLHGTSLLFGQVATIRYQATIANEPVTTLGQTLVNSPTMTWTSTTGDNPNERTGEGGINDYNDTTSATVTVMGWDLHIEKTHTVPNVKPGDPLVFTISYRNNGNGPAYGVVVTETVPESTVFDAASSVPTTWSCPDRSPAGTTCTVSVGDLQPGDGGSLSFGLMVDPTIPSGKKEIVNTTTIKDDGNHGTGQTPGDDTATDRVPIVAQINLSITKDDGVNVVAPGSELTYTLTVRNTGTTGATGVSVTDTLPVGLSYVSSKDLVTNNAGTYDDSKREITWAPFTLEVGAEHKLSVTAKVDLPLDPAITSFDNVAVVKDDGANGADPTPDDNTAHDVDTVAEAGKQLVDTNQDFTETPDVAIGEILTYEVKLTVAPGKLEHLVMTDILDRGLAFVNCQVTGDADLASAPTALDQICDTQRTIVTDPANSTNPADAGRKMTLNFGTLTNSHPTDHRVLTVRYQVVVLNNGENKRGVELKNNASWQWDGGTHTLTSQPIKIVEPELEIAKEANTQYAIPGQILTYKITMKHTKNSNSDAFDVTIKDVLPPTLEYVPGTLISVAGPAPTTITDVNAPTLEVYWKVIPLGSATIEIQFKARILQIDAKHPVTNAAEVVWSSVPGDVSLPQSTFNNLSVERSYNPQSTVDVYGASTSTDVTYPGGGGNNAGGGSASGGGLIIPATGFAPNVVTDLPEQPAAEPYQDLGDIWIEIPALNVKLPITGVPLGKNGWDLTWLREQAGWLDGTAFPGWAGNTVVTAHLTGPDGKAGPFANLSSLRWGDKILLHVYGQTIQYEVQTSQILLPTDLSPLKHEDLPWLTLITCRQFDPATGTYQQRVVVRAVKTK